MQIYCLIKPNSKIDRISINADGSLRIKIKAPPVDGKANEYLIGYLAETFDLPKKDIQIISGFTGSHKRINIVAEEQTIKNKLSSLRGTK
ncbi:MAG: DUF167 domain-containing protein [Bacteroidetes bacterium]|nr:DUF167 domain-containing protein [Bacteroidota bacterium]